VAGQIFLAPPHYSQRTVFASLRAFSFERRDIIIIIITTTIYIHVIMTEVIARVHSVHLVNVEQRQTAADPQTKPPDLAVSLPVLGS